MYSPRVLDHFENPRNAGDIENADAVVKIENPACGDVLQLAARTIDGRVTDVRFRAQGCVAAMACASALTVLLKGKRIDEARRLDRDEVLNEVGGLPEASGHAAHLAVDAWRALLKQLETQPGK
jgi:nitrogen fixation NifU-like protein